MNHNKPFIHDKFMKELLSDKEVAIAFLREYMPKEIIEHIEINSISQENTTYISSNLQESFSDIVWRFETKTEPLKVCLLLEHKSYKDPNVVFQILEYLALGYQQQLKNQKKAELIVPILYYHGESKWYLKDFESYFDKYPAEFKHYLPAYKNEFINLNSLGIEQITSLQNGMLKSALLIQRHYFDPEQLHKNIFNIIKSLEPYFEKNLSNSIFVYLIHFLEFDKAKLLENIENFPKDFNDKIMSLYDQLIKEGFEKGIEKGKTEGTEKLVLNAFDLGYKLQEIAKISELNETEVHSILKKNGKA
jgi:predicted transposase/invertase (TIGR01784 family)